MPREGLLWFSGRLHVLILWCGLCQTTSTQQLSPPMGFGPISVTEQGEIWTKLGPGDQATRFSKAEFLSLWRLRNQVAALQDKLYLYKHLPLLQTAAAPASQGFGFILLPVAGLTALPGRARAAEGCGRGAVGTRCPHRTICQHWKHDRWD